MIVFPFNYVNFLFLAAQISGGSNSLVIQAFTAESETLTETQQLIIPRMLGWVAGVVISSQVHCKTKYHLLT